jgi:hypothetical protein
MRYLLLVLLAALLVSACGEPRIPTPAVLAPTPAPLPTAGIPAVPRSTTPDGVQRVLVVRYANGWELAPVLEGPLFAPDGSLHVVGPMHLDAATARVASVEGWTVATNGQSGMAYVASHPDRMAQLAGTPVPWIVIGADLTPVAQGIDAPGSAAFCADTTWGQPCLYWSGAQVDVIDVATMGVQ